jgi:hypothetical protein
MIISKANILVGVKNFYLDGVDLGATVGGVEVTKALEVTEKEVDQLLDATDLVPKKYMVTVKTELAEATLANLKKVWNEAAAPEQAGRVQPIGLSQELPEYELKFTGPDPAGDTRTYIFFRAIAVEAGAQQLKKDGQTVFPVTFRCLPDLDVDLDHCYGTCENET